MSLVEEVLFHFLIFLCHFMAWIYAFTLELVQDLPRIIVEELLKEWVLERLRRWREGRMDRRGHIHA